MLARFATRSQWTGAALIAGIAGTLSPAAADSSFRGAYAGVQASYETLDVGVRSPTLSAGDLHLSGLSGGVHGGFNAGVSGRTIVGVEAGFAVSGADGGFSSGGERVAVASRYTYDLSGRAGYEVADKTLLYGRLGWARTKFSGFEPGRRTHLDGVRFGGGAEHMVDERMSLRAEFTRTEYNGIRGGGRQFEPGQNLVTLGVSRHF